MAQSFVFLSYRWSGATGWAQNQCCMGFRPQSWTSPVCRLGAGEELWPFPASGPWGVFVPPRVPSLVLTTSASLGDSTALPHSWVSGPSGPQRGKPCHKGLKVPGNLGACSVADSHGCRCGTCLPLSIPLSYMVRQRQGFPRPLRDSLSPLRMLQNVPS